MHSPAAYSNLLSSALAGDDTSSAAASAAAASPPCRRSPPCCCAAATTTVHRRCGRALDAAGGARAKEATKEAILAAGTVGEAEGKPTGLYGNDLKIPRRTSGTLWRVRPGKHMCCVLRRVADHFRGAPLQLHARLLG